MSCIADNCPGTLCLDVDSAPKWQIDCNICWHLRTDLYQALRASIYVL